MSKKLFVFAIVFCAVLIVVEGTLSVHSDQTLESSRDFLVHGLSIKNMEDRVGSVEVASAVSPYCKELCRKTESLNWFIDSSIWECDCFSQYVLEPTVQGKGFLDFSHGAGNNAFLVVPVVNFSNTIINSSLIVEISLNFKLLWSPKTGDADLFMVLFETGVGAGYTLVTSDNDGGTLFAGNSSITKLGDTYHNRIDLKTIQSSIGFPRHQEVLGSINIDFVAKKVLLFAKTIHNGFTERGPYTAEYSFEASPFAFENVLYFGLFRGNSFEKYRIYHLEVQAMIAEPV